MLEERAKTETTAIARMTNVPFCMDTQSFRRLLQRDELTGAHLTFHCGLLMHPIFNAGLWIDNRIAAGIACRIS
jgi:hypothetical protein